MNICIIGAGAWGTALAIHFAHHPHRVTLWTHDPQQAQVLQRERRNQSYLKDIPFPDSLQIGSDHAPATPDAVIIATPVAALPNVLERLRQWGWAHLPIITACKGFEPQSGLLPHQTVQRILGAKARPAILSGPSFAQELAQQLPCAVTLAAADLQLAERLAEQLNSPVLRLYANDDLTGVAVGGAVKNIMAIATGIADGLDYGLNARAALMTRGLAEINRLAQALGARETTLMGLSGVGDLILTCTGGLSRNRQVGLGLAQGKSLDTILQELGHVAEGVYAVHEAAALAQRHQIEMPITLLLKDLFENKIQINEVAEHLMGRKIRAEHT